MTDTYFSIFLSTPSARRATGDALHDRVDIAISIHALREEGDPTPSADANLASLFLSTPSARRATGLNLLDVTQEKFLSTPSARRATPQATTAHKNKQISIHALREEGDQMLDVATAIAAAISIHALREEGDGGRTG